MNESSDRATMATRPAFGSAAYAPWLCAIAGSALAGAESASTQPRAEIFAPGVVSTGKEMAITVSPDSSTIYFSRQLESLSHDPKKHSAVFWSQRTGDGWSGPQMTPYSGEYSAVDPAISPDGARLYLMTTRPATGGAALEKADIWVVTHERDGWTPPSWSEPRPLGPEINLRTSREGSPSASDRSLDFFSDRPGGHGASDIYVSRIRNGEHQPAENLGPIVNSATWEAHPFVDRDERFLLFASERAGGFGGCDLYLSFHDHGDWTPARNLGPTVNTPDCEMLPVVSPDGEYLYFTRVAGNGESNLFRLPFTDLRREAR